MTIFDLYKDTILKWFENNIEQFDSVAFGVLKQYKYEMPINYSRTMLSDDLCLFDKLLLKIVYNEDVTSVEIEMVGAKHIDNPAYGFSIRIFSENDDTSLNKWQDEYRYAVKAITGTWIYQSDENNHII